MIKIIRYIQLSICFLLMLNPVLAQDKDEFNRMIQDANSHVYSNPEKAIELGLDIFQQSKDSDIQITALAIVVNGYSSIHEIGQALNYSQKAMKIAEKSGSVSHQIWALGLMGEQYQVGGQNIISRVLLNKAKNLIFSADLSEESKALALGNIFAITGNGYKDEIDCKYAIQNYDRAIEAYQPFFDNSAAKNNLALVYLEKGDCLLDLNLLNEAKKYYENAIQIALESNLQEYRQRGKTGIAKIESKLGNYEKSSFLSLALLNESAPELPLKLKNEVYQVLAFNSLKQESFEDFEFYNNAYSTTSQEILVSKNKIYEQVLNFIEKKSSVQKSSFNLPVIAFVILFLAIIIFEYLFQTKNKPV